MKSILITFSISAAMLILPLSVAQTPNSTDQERILALIKEVQIQQAQIVDNQAKIETKLADLAETIRVARIHAARAR